MRDIMILIVLMLGSFKTYASHQTICRDGVGSEIIIDWTNDEIGRSGIYPGARRDQMYLGYKIKGPAQKNFSWNPGADHYSSPTSAVGYLLDDGQIFISFMHQRSSTAFLGHWKNDGSLVVKNFWSKTESWVFQDCFDRK